MKPRRLLRAAIPDQVIGLASPATPHSRRVAVQALDDDACSIYIASGSHIYNLKVVLPESEVVEGKESLLVPSDTQIFESRKLDLSSPHRAEVQCLALSSTPSPLLASADSYGHLLVSQLDSLEEKSYSLSPPNAGAGEGGWAGCAFSPLDSSQIAVARGFARSIDVYSKDIHVRTLYTLQIPTALTFLNGTDAGGSVLALSEGPQVSVWDLRAGERGGCIRRFLGSFTGDSLYTISSNENGVLGTGGADRALTMFDTKRWAARARWVNALKYEVTGMEFSAVNRNTVFAYGLDYEVAGGEWSDSDSEGTVKRSFAFRGDSRWLGLGKCSTTDLMAGWSENGSIFVADFA